MQGKEARGSWLGKVFWSIMNELECSIRKLSQLVLGGRTLEISLAALQFFFPRLSQKPFNPTIFTCLPVDGQ